MNNFIDTKEISAELFLNLYYPDLIDKWIVRNEGAFYRNYNADVLSVDEETSSISLSRDGFLKLLPQGLLTNDDDLKGDNFKAKYEEFVKKQRILQETFVPFDSFLFRRRMHIEREVSELLNSRIDFMLKTYFGYDRRQEKNRYIKILSVIMPYISKIRGNMYFLKDLLSAVVGCDIVMSFGRYSEKDNTRYWLPWVKYSLLIPDLSGEQYRERAAEIDRLEHFVNEWFMPFDTKCSLRIKYGKQALIGEGNLILDYNVGLK